MNYGFGNVDTLARNYFEHCLEEDVRPVIIGDIDKTAIKKRAATEIGTELLYKDARSFAAGLPGALETLYNLKVLHKETEAFKVFRDTLEAAGVTTGELNHYAQKIVGKTINLPFVRVLKGIQEEYDELKSGKNDLQKPFLMLKTTGLDAVPAAVHKCLKEYRPSMDNSFDVLIVGNPYKPLEMPKAGIDAQVFILQPYNGITDMPITEENQVEVIDTWLNNNTGSGLENAVVIEDRDTFANTPWAFIASNFAKQDVKDKANYVMQ